MKGVRLPTISQVTMLTMLLCFLQRKDDGKPTLQDLPVNCQRVLLQCFSDPADVIHVAETNKHLYMLGSDPLLWEKLFFYHFTEAQVSEFTIIYLITGVEMRRGCGSAKSKFPLKLNR